MYEIVEKKAVEIARRMRAELWAVSARSGDGVQELFSRVASLAFNASILREVQSVRLEPIAVGTDLISTFFPSPPSLSTTRFLFFTL